MNRSKIDAKVVLLGKYAVGKTCLLNKYFCNQFLEDIQTTVGAAFATRQEEVDGNIVNLQIWDTAGGEQYRALCSLYYRKAIVAIICYDVTDAESFDTARFWVRELRKNKENCEIFLCGTKLDLIKNGQERKIDRNNVGDYADEIVAKVFETSSRTGENISELFHDVAKTCLEKMPVNPPIGDIGGQGLVSLEMEKQKKRKRC